MSKNRKSDFLFCLDELIILSERAKLLTNCTDFKLLKPYLNCYDSHNIVKAALNSGISRATFYRKLSNLNKEADYIRCGLLRILDIKDTKPLLYRLK